jgi:hypothetical protein
MLLNTKPQYLQLKKGLYPALVGTFVGLQITLVVAVVAALRRGLVVMRWGEACKRKEWERMMGNWRLQERNLFLFWRFPDEKLVGNGGDGSVIFLETSNSTARFQEQTE